MTLWQALARWWLLREVARSREHQGGQVPASAPDEMDLSTRLPGDASDKSLTRDCT
jgi:hypothetical protein